MKFFELLVCYRRRSLGQRINGALGLREGDNIADGIQMEHKHDEAVEAQGNACMRRSTVLECIQEESELLLCFFLGNADGFEYLFLQVFLVNTERAAAGFYAIQYFIFCFGL